MYNNRQIGVETGGKKPLVSNQVVGGSSLSGRAKLIKHLRHFRKFESSNRFLILKVVIEDCDSLEEFIRSLRCNRMTVLWS